ncbi:MAG: hypothetical protein H6849_00350 [Alphaproteobacteria bacterium]|nr:MAG: hypothetical protein H6849_00350 [Alphaproteobacteria bacterium]
MMPKQGIFVRTMMANHSNNQLNRAFRLDICASVINAVVWSCSLRFRGALNA